MGPHLSADFVSRHHRPIIVARGKRNLAYYPYRENFRYTLQRWTGVIAFAFILWHVFQTRGWINNSQWWLEHVTRKLGGGLFDPKHAVSDRRRSRAAGSVGRARLCGRHPGLGLPLCQRPVDDGDHLGRVDRPPAQRWATVFCAAFGLALAGAGLAALYGFWFFHHIT